MTTSPKTALPKRYLGDGVYVESGVFVGEFILTTTDGISVTNSVVLDGEITRAFMRYVEETRAHITARNHKRHPQTGSPESRGRRLTPWR